MRTTIIIAALLMAGEADAIPVNANAADGIAALDGNTLLCTSGQVFVCHFNDILNRFYWGHEEWRDLPVPAADIADWNATGSITTNSGEHWFYYPGYENSPPRGWYKVGGGLVPFPDCIPIGAEHGSLGDLKSMFR